ncbi:nitronate monooxygenase [Rhodobacterales bacterium HKCCE2091]|nr:nitronate monooxygenase [Rhodobacterales bacterium HKCCE2091]
MFTVTGPDLVTAAARAGIMAGLPRNNARDLAEFDGWLGSIRSALDLAEAEGATCGPVAVNLSTGFSGAELTHNLEVCRRHGVEIIISATGDPTDLIARVHDWGGLVLHDVVNLRFAEKAMAAGADGLNCIGAGGGGHSGTVSHFALVQKVRSMFDGLVTVAGAVGTGGAVRAGEMLGADLAYMGTRFIATAESAADPDYKRMLVEAGLKDLIYTPRVAVTPASWLRPSLTRNGLDPDDLPLPRPGGERYAHLPPDARPWKTIWSAGQGVELIRDVPAVADLVDRIEDEYRAACAVPHFQAFAGTR